MNLWYALCEALPIEMLRWDFMKNAMLAILLISPLFSLMSPMVVTGKMSFFSDALGHSAFTGIAIGCICGLTMPTLAAVIFCLAFSLLFSFVLNRSNHATDTIIGVFSSAAVALGIFIATLDGGSFAKYNAYLIGDILSVTPEQIAMLALLLLSMIVFWVLCGNRLALTLIHPQLAASRGIKTKITQAIFNAAVALVVTLTISGVGLLILNSLLVLPAATAKNLSKNWNQYHLFSVLLALAAGIGGLTVSYYLGCSAGAAISLILSLLFAISFMLRKRRA